MRGLFVSKEHQRQAELRTHIAYRFAAYILSSSFVFQIPFGLLMFREKQTQAELGHRNAAAIEEKARILSKSEPLREMVQKIQEAQRWNETSIHKTAVTEVLSQLEKSLSADICLTEVSIQNKAQNLWEPDRFEIEIRGVGRAREPELWMHSLEENFQSWDVLQSHSGKGVTAEGTEGLVPFSLLLQQQTTP